MAVVRTFSLAFSLTAVTTRPLELSVWNFVWSKIINMFTNGVRNVVCEIIWIWKCVIFKIKERTSSAVICLNSYGTNSTGFCLL
jgi:hypothetical protein